MYSARQLLRGIKDPKRGLREANKLYHTRGWRREYNPAGVDVFDEEWDNLLILDACRYDTFRDEHTLDGTLERRTSRGSGTYDFLTGNLTDRELHDTVYVTANPMIAHHEFGAEFHAVERVFATDWDDDRGTVRPGPMTDRVLAAAEEYPDKRVLAHYLQPHYPYLGETGREQIDHRGMRFWNRVFSGDLQGMDESILERAYVECLQTALPEVRRAVEGLEGRTVVTADHGEVFGTTARPIPITEYGHPFHTYIPELVTVPWFVCDHDARKTIRAEPPRDREEVAADVEGKLADLGYA